MPSSSCWSLFGSIYPINDSFIKVSSMKAYEWNSAFHLPVLWQQWVDLIPLCFERHVSRDTWCFLSKRLRLCVCVCVCVCVCSPRSGLEQDLEIFHNLRSNPCVLFTWFNPQTCEMETTWRHVYGLTHCGSSTDTHSRVGVEKSSWVLLLYSYSSEEKLQSSSLLYKHEKNHSACLSWDKSFEFLSLSLFRTVLHIPEETSINPESWVTGQWQNASKHTIMCANPV